MAWGDTPHATIDLKPLISCALIHLPWALGLLKPLVSPIYTFCTKTEVTGTDINFLRNHNFLKACPSGGHRSSRRAGKQAQFKATWLVY